MASGDITLKNKTSGSSRVGYLVKAVRDGFEYAQVGDTPIGVVINSVPKGQDCQIRTSGDAIAFLSTVVTPGDELRMHVSKEGGRSGAIRNVGSETDYTSVGRAIGKGKGLVRIALNISSSSSSVSSGGEGVTDHTLLTNIGTLTHAEIDTHITDVTTNPHGIVTVAGYAIDTLVSGVSTTVSLNLSELDEDEDAVVFNAGMSGDSTWLVFTSGIDPGMKVIPADVKLSYFNNDLGWTSGTGIVESVTASAPLASSGGANPNITFDEDSIAVDGTAMLATDYFVVIDTFSNTMVKHLMSGIHAELMNYPAIWDAGGTLQSVIAGYGIASDGDLTDPTISIDLSELDSATSETVFNAGMSGGSTWLVFTSGTDPGQKISPGVVKLSYFVNDLGWTSNTGTVTGVTASSPLSSTGGTAPNISFDASGFNVNATLLGPDYVVGFFNDNFGKTKLENISADQFDYPALWDEGSNWDVVSGGVNYSGGYVGIGDSTPSYMLDITQTAGQVGIGLKASSSNGQGPLLMFRNTNTSQITGAEAGRIGFYKDDGSVQGGGWVSRIRSLVSDAIGGTYDLYFETGQDVNTPAGTNGTMYFASTGILTISGYYSSTGASRIYNPDGATRLNLNPVATTHASIYYYNEAGGGFKNIKFGSNTTNKSIYWDDSNSRVGINDDTPLYTLDVAGTGRYTGALVSNSEITAYSSDKRLKHSIKTIENALDLIDQINGVYYSWRDGVEELGFIPTHKREIGFIAQNLLPIVPDAVALAPFDHDTNGKSKSGKDYLTVKPEKLIPLILEGVKELRRELAIINNHLNI